MRSPESTVSGDCGQRPASAANRPLTKEAMTIPPPPPMYLIHDTSCRYRAESRVRRRPFALRQASVLRGSRRQRREESEITKVLRLSRLPRLRLLQRIVAFAGRATIAPSCALRTATKSSWSSRRSRAAIKNAFTAARKSTAGSSLERDCKGAR